MISIGELVRSQTEVFIVAILVGAALCFVYDWLRVLRRLFPHGDRSVGIEDLGYWFLWILVVMAMLDEIDSGVVRGFSLGGVGIGMLLYFFLISPWFLRIAVFLMEKILWIFSGIFRVLFFPFQKTSKILTDAGRYIFQKGRCFWKKHKPKAFAEGRHEEKTQADSWQKKTNRKNIYRRNHVISGNGNVHSDGASLPEK